MEDINVKDVLEKMIVAFKEILTDHWSDVKPFASQELKSLAENLELIGLLKAANKITEEQAKLYVDIQKSSVRIALLTVEGLSVIAIEKAINAAINAVKTIVNTAIGWVIL